MGEREIIKEYVNGDLIVIWKPKKCIHAAECVKRLPEVYNPDEKPWIKAENANIEDLKKQIQACPSGALTYKMANVETQDDAQSEIKIEVLQNGPLLVHGTLHVTNSDGNNEVKDKTTAFCRCGASANKPYCDGAHRNVDFKG